LRDYRFRSTNSGLAVGPKRASDAFASRSADAFQQWTSDGPKPKYESEAAAARA